MEEVGRTAGEAVDRERPQGRRRSGYHHEGAQAVARPIQGGVLTSVFPASLAPSVAPMTAAGAPRRCFRWRVSRLSGACSRGPLSRMLNGANVDPMNT